MKMENRLVLFGVVFFGFLRPAFAGTDANICVQGELTELGFYSGKISGKIDGPTRAAGDKYIKYMMANSPGWAQPRLTSSEATLWCRQLAAAFPDKLSKYLAAFQGEGTSVVTIGDLSVKGSATTKKPYEVQVAFTVEGSFPASVKSACFMWNGRSEVCITPPNGISQSPFIANLKTGRAGKYNLNVYLKYESGGKKLKSAETSTPLKVDK